jgi:hypothetical protein
VKVFNLYAILIMSIYTSAWRKAANEALVLFFDVKLARVSYIEAAKRHGWPSY